MADTLPLQEQHLNELRKSKTKVSLFLINGVKLQGLILGYDTFCILLGDGSRKQLIYKHAVSTVVPLEAMPAA